VKLRNKKVRRQNQMGSKTFLDEEWGYLVKRHLHWLVGGKPFQKKIIKCTDLYESHTSYGEHT
jgi:hypothetical protein